MKAVQLKGNLYTLSEETTLVKSSEETTLVKSSEETTLLKFVLSPFWKEVYTKRKEFAPP